jgi:hypothetical protein
METVFNIYIFQSSTHSYYWFSYFSFHLPFFYASLIFSHSSHTFYLFFITLYIISHVLHPLFPFVPFLGVLYVRLYELTDYRIFAIFSLLFPYLLLKVYLLELPLLLFFLILSLFPISHSLFFCLFHFYKAFQISSFCSVPSFLFLNPVSCIALAVPAAYIPCFLFLISCSVLPETIEDRKVSLNSYPFSMSFQIPSSCPVSCFLFSASCPLFPVPSSLRRYRTGMLASIGI